MSAPPVRVLIVDDSASMRAVLRRILSADPEIEVVGLAPEPDAARAMIKDLNPDVVTLDIEMPGMDGLSFLEKIMRLRPMPVVMCSTLTARGAEATIEALRLGAVDCIAKPTGNPLDIAHSSEKLCATVKAAARSKVNRSPEHSKPIDKLLPNSLRDVVIAIGASTGGVEALFHILKTLPANSPPILVVQHMPAAFTGGFAARLDKECALNVVEARDGTPIQCGTVYIAPGGNTHMELAGGVNGRIKLRASAAYGGHRPSVDILFHSVAPLGSSAVGVILTGMGCDGADGLLAMHAAGARTLGQNQETCVVYGMPRAAFVLGAIDREIPLSALPEAILRACRK
ncbi:chemotaxis response regulator protein-glutamate methylesterase [soil metagenome]|jgi:two-component system chemotaxis response regulator CheB|uniref:protein-glutamate methylesterase/protein-glutamine glutaminase n=1 Tax=Sphingobium sp. CECT 9361 TaxID=2845384 RepID=UPI001E3B7C9F|nr:chemotaxis response regulator protein-glutamate methylesterase [Sphingobium sp. CECT 9361]CAH0356124.1 Protein-glutamate methylesterase/protein-glutamine glutaminase [Sphingobium sp. CECT 9361]